MGSDNNIKARRSGRFSKIITIPANQTKKIDFSSDNYAPYLNYRLRNLSDYSLKYWINNVLGEEEFEFLDSGDILVEEAQTLRKFEFQNSNAEDVQIVLTLDNKITPFELEKLKVGEMKYE